MNIQKGCSAGLQVAQNCKGMAIILTMTEVRAKKSFLNWAGINEVKLNRDTYEEDFESAAGRDVVWQHLLGNVLVTSS